MLLSVLFGLFLWVPGALSLDTMVDVPVGGAAAPVDATAPDPAPVSAAPVAPVAADPVTVAPDPIVVAPDPVPVVPDPVPVVPDPVPVVPAPVSVAPDPVAAAPAPAPVAPPVAVAAPVDPAPPAANPPAPPDLTVAVHDASTVAASTATDALSVTASDPGIVATRIDVGDPAAPGATNAVAPTATAASGKLATDSSIITPLVVPIVQTLGTGLLAPYVRPETFGPQTSQTNKAGAPPTAPAPMPARPAQASSVTLFGVAVPTGGWSGHSAGILALLMGLLPLGLPDGKAALGGSTQLAVLLLGAMLMLIPFFASFIRDDRRRGPRGFAALALRPG